MKYSMGILLFVLFFNQVISAQDPIYPQNYFRHPLNIPMQLVANFGEIRTNHWHMGLDIRTQQKLNLPVYAAAEGYVSRVSVEPGGFGQAIYISHPNGFTTLYGHLNSFFPALAKYVKDQQYARESWNINLILEPGQFPVNKGDFIALSGSTGASEGPHVHFEIRDSKTENCLNPILFRFPIADAVPPTINRLVMYNRNKSTYDQFAQNISIHRSGRDYTIPSNLLRVGTNKISFAIGAVDRFSATPNPNGIYSAKVLMDNQPVSSFQLDNISYDDTRYINAQLDFPMKTRGAGTVQHLSPLPGASETAYDLFNGDGIIHLNDHEVHAIVIEVRDANDNLSKINFNIQYDPSVGPNAQQQEGEQWIPGQVNIFEKDRFEIFSTEKSIYDTIKLTYSISENSLTNAVSPLAGFLSPAFPSHDSLTIRLRSDREISTEEQNKIVIKNISGTKTFIKKASWQNGWFSAKFRQFGTYQAFLDLEPPTVNPPPANLTKASRIVFNPKDNFNSIKSFRAELDGQWLRFTNDKGRSWVYNFDEKFPGGTHELKVIIIDEAGNVLERAWTVRR